MLSPLGAPPELAGSLAGNFGFEEAFPVTAQRISQPNPSEVKHLVYQNAFEFPPQREHRTIQQNDALGNRRRCKMRAQGSPDLDTDGSAAQGG